MSRVIILHHVSGQGGGTKSMIDLGVMLSRQHEVILCIPKNSAETVRLAEEHGLKCHELNTPIPSLNVFSGAPGILSGYFLTRAARFVHTTRLVSEMMSLNPDIVIFNTFVITPIAAALPEGVKRIGVVRETFRPSPLTGLIRKSLNDYCDGVIYIAKYDMDFIHLDRPKQLVTPDCLEPRAVVVRDRTALKKEMGIPEHSFCALFMGGLTPVMKGLDILLEAAEFLDDGFRIIVAGNINHSALTRRFILTHLHNPSYARYLNAVRTRLEPLTAAGKVIQTGYVTDISPYMTVCDTVVFPSTAAHQPRPCIEAGMFYRSVVLSDYEATREYFRDGVNALTFRPKDPRDLAEKLRFLRDNPELNRRLSENNYKFSQELHNYAATRERFVAFLNEVLDSDCHRSSRRPL